MLRTYPIELPQSAFSALRKEPAEFIREMKYAAVVKWYEMGGISQGKTAETTGLSRYDFIPLLTRYKVSVIQYTEKSLEEVVRWSLGRGDIRFASDNRDYTEISDECCFRRNLRT